MHRVAIYLFMLQSIFDCDSRASFLITINHPFLILDVAVRSGEMDDMTAVL